MCAIIGIIGARKAAERAMLGLHAMQHRAIDYAGIATSDGNHFYAKHGAGLARQVFLEHVGTGATGNRTELDLLHGTSAIGHLRYPTVSDTAERINIQPIEGLCGNEKFYLAHNGNLTDVPKLMSRLEGVTLQTNMDSELIVRLIEKEYTGNLLEDIGRACNYLSGSYSLVILFKDRLIAVKDPFGNRPLSVGRTGDTVVVASETCVFDALETTFENDIPAGCVFEFNSNGTMAKHRFADPQQHRECIFEIVYYSSPASRTFRTPVSSFREDVGEAFEREAPVPGADFVVGVPDSGTAFAVGWGRSGRSGLFRPAIIRSHYVGRTFIAPTQELRDTEVSQKFHFDAETIRDKRVVLMDDSIVRLTTLPKVVRRLRLAGAKEVHVRIAFPPIKHPCLYGINTPTTEELSAANHSVEEIRELAGADTLVYMDLTALKKVAADSETGWCDACVTGNYWHKGA